MGKLLSITLIGVLLAFIGERIVKYRHRMNYLREVEPVELPNCQLLKGIECGSEDIDILPDGRAFISSGIKYPGIMSFQPDRPGEIFLLDLNDESLHPVPLLFSQGFELSTFSPHGISTYIDEKDGTVYLFVVNHPKHKTTVERFKFNEEENVLIHLKTIKHELLPNVNDIIAVGPESFYATNDFYFCDHTMRQLEMFLGIAWANVVYYSPSEVKKVASGYYLANGITMSTDKKYIYVADSFSHTINVLEKHADWSLTPVKECHITVGILDLLKDQIKYQGPKQVSGHLLQDHYRPIFRIYLQTISSEFLEVLVTVCHVGTHAVVSGGLAVYDGVLCVFWVKAIVFQVLELETIVDNLFLDPKTGDIWTGGHPNGFKLFSYNTEDLPGSEVIRVQNIHSNNPIVTEVYVNNGSVIQAASSAAVYEGKLLVGTVFHKALYCELE